MEPKKNPNLDLNKDRLVYRALGYAFVLMFTYIMFSFTFYEKKKVRMKTAIITDDAEQIENTQHEAAPPPPPPPPTLQVVEDAEEETNEFQSTEFEEDQKITDVEVNDVKEEKEVIIEDDQIYEGELDKAIEFKGGEEALVRFLSENLEYPETPKANEIEGVVIVTFVIEKNGSISGISTDGKGDKELEKEARRVISKTSGMWIPAEYKKKPKKTYCKIPIIFELEDE